MLAGQDAQVGVARPLRMATLFPQPIGPDFVKVHPVERINLATPRGAGQAPENRGVSLNCFLQQSVSSTNSENTILKASKHE